MKQDSEFYLDYAAAAPVWPAAMQAVTTALAQHGNPSSFHDAGRSQRHAWQQHMERIAAHLGCTPDELILTSGATESIATAIHGILAADPAAHCVSTLAEHAAADAAIRAAGNPTTWVPTTELGQVSAAAVAAAIRPNTRLISLLAAHNETGTVQQVRSITKAVRSAERRLGHRILLHWDASQWAAWHPLNLHQLGADLVSISGAKLGAPASGLLYVKRGTTLQPLIRGGNQQHGRRGGTEDVPAAAGLAIAFDETRAVLPVVSEEVRAARRMLGDTLEAAFPSLVRRDQEDGLPNILHITLPGLDAEQAVYALSDAGISVATGAACSSAQTSEAARVRTGLRVPRNQLGATLRISLGWHTTRADIARLTPTMIDILRSIMDQTSITSSLQQTGTALNQAYAQEPHAKQ